MKPSIFQISRGIDVSDAIEQIDSQDDVWNRQTIRTEHDKTPHKDIPDIWVRYNAWENFSGNSQSFNDKHESSWYPVIDQLPAVKKIIFDVMHYVQGERLGGVLITKVPIGNSVKPHVDNGWHASYYSKFAVQLKGNVKQSFNFNDASFSAIAGDLYTFDNSSTHWVTNDSDEDRITLIICIRGSRYDQSL